jgi:cobalt-precorrin-5B (C1)-methyltransferase
MSQTPSPALKTGHSPQLRTGYTTGACAAAAAKGAALMLAHQMTVREVSITLPAGVIATFQLHGQLFTAHESSCHVIKDAGDDPDVTNGAEVHAQVAATSLSPSIHTGENSIIISGGAGIGKVTKPGLAVPPGEWAINPVPRRMITEAVRSVFSPSTRNPSPLSLSITISIPDGEERSKKTLNARLGIIGGLSILGTTGIVRPISAKAWTDTIDAALDVARACGCRTVVLSTGRTSEMAAQKLFNNPGSVINTDNLFSATRNTNIEALPEEAFVMMGDHVAYALKACHLRGFRQPVLACQFAKLLKIACGHENTHAAASQLDLDTLLAWGQEEGLSDLTLSTISTANTAREIAIACSFDQQMLNLIFKHARTAAARHTPGMNPHFLVADYSGTCVFYGD